MYTKIAPNMTAPNFSRKIAPKEPEQQKIGSQSKNIDEVICCGVKIDFYEDCGHTMTLADHHRSCIHFNKDENFPYERVGRLLISRPPPPSPIRMAPKPGSQLPFPQPRCRDLHRYINLVPGKCGCTYPERYDSLSAIDPIPERSDRTELSPSAILKRRIYWLQQQSLDAQTLASVRLLEWSTKVRKHQ